MKPGIILAVAAEAREFSGLVKRAQGVVTIELGIQFACWATVREQPWLLVADGAGPRCARNAVRAGLAQMTARAVLSTGTCGAVAAGLDIGSIVVAEEVAGSAGAWKTEAPDSDMPAVRGRVWSQDRVAVKREEKRAIAARGFAAVEMEAAAVAEEAQRRGLPFYCVRAVSDAAEDEMPLDFNAFRDEAGRFRVGRIALAALLRPGKIPGLVDLARAGGRASVQLGEFLVNCEC